MEVKFQPTQSDFFKTLRLEVNDYFKRKNIKSTGGFNLLAKTLIIFGVLAGIYLWLVAFSPGSWWICIGLYVFMGFVMALIGFNVMHDGSHGSYSQNKVLNKIMAHSLNFLGGNSQLWSKKHNINHHTYTNVESVDDDIDLDPFLRLHDGQPRKWFHRYQHIYALFLYGTTYIFWIYFLDFKKYFTGRIAEDTPIPQMSFKDHVVFWMSKVVHVFVFIFIPCLMLGLAKAITGYVIAAVVTGFIISIVFQLAHIVEGTQFSIPENKGVVIDIQSEWAIHQVLTTVNFATDNRLVTWLLGGLNYQMIHHLFPKISHVHYPAIRPLVIAACKEYNINYIEFPRVTTAIRSHIRHLKMTGNR